MSLFVIESVRGVIKKLRHKIVYDDFLNNSAFLFFSTVITSVGGLVFWVIGARLYEQQSIGIATSIISAVSLIVLLTRFGFNQSLIRFLPERNQNQVYSTIIYFLSISVIGTTLIAVVLFEDWLLSYNVEPFLAAILVLFALASSTCGINSQSMIAKKRSKYFLYQNILLALRPIFLPVFLFIGGATAIVLSMAAGYFVTAIFSTWLVLRMGLSFSSFDWNFFRESLSFSGSNYVASIFTKSTSNILPLMVLHLLGPESTAVYYITQTASRVLEFLPQALSTSLFVEGSHGSETTNKLSLVAIIVIPIVTVASIVVYYFGPEILSIFDESYTSGSDLLFVFTASIFFVTIYKIALSKIRVKRDNRDIIKLSGARFVLILLLSYIFISEYGLIGAGYGHLASYGLLSAVIIIKRYIYSYDGIFFG